jgi:hypothetical protein
LSDCNYAILAKIHQVQHCDGCATAVGDVGVFAIVGIVLGKVVLAAAGYAGEKNERRCCGEKAA